MSASRAREFREARKRDRWEMWKWRTIAAVWWICAIASAVVVGIGAFNLQWIPVAAGVVQGSSFWIAALWAEERGDRYS